MIPEGVTLASIHLAFGERGTVRRSDGFQECPGVPRAFVARDLVVLLVFPSIRVSLDDLGRKVVDHAIK